MAKGKQVAAEHVAPSLRGLLVGMETLSEDPKNARRHDERNLAAITRSLKRYGQQKPIVADTAGVIIAGNGTFRAAKRLGWTDVAATTFAGSKEEAVGFAIADNRTAELAAWEDGALVEALQFLTGLDDGQVSDVGFSDAEFRALQETLQAIDAAADPDSDEAPELPASADSKRGEVYQLGPHRLVCGDSTDPTVVALACDGKMADMLFTDPPYGVAYQSPCGSGGTKANHRKIANDDLSPAALEAFLTAAVIAAAESMRPGAAAYVFHTDQKVGIRSAFEVSMGRAGIQLAGCLVWAKRSGTMGWQDYRNQYEPILYGWKQGADRNHVMDRTQTTVWEEGSDGAATYQHPTQKPVALSRRACRNSTHAGDLCLDIFGGSGFTLIGAAQENRVAAIVELDELYCDVIRRRWTRYATARNLEVGAGGLE